MYEPSVAEDPEEDKHHHPRPGLAALQQPTPKPPVQPPRSNAKEPLESSSEWNLVRSTNSERGETAREDEPLAAVESSDAVV